MNDSLGKEAESKIADWLDRPELGYSFNRIYDQMSGYYGVSRNICDFILYKHPYIYYIESKSTWDDRFDFSEISDTQYDGLLCKSKIFGCVGVVIVLFASYKKAVTLNIKDIDYSINVLNKKSLNIVKPGKKHARFKEIQTIPNNRKKHLDYTGNIEDYIYF